MDPTDAGVLYALLLLFRTQHCTTRVHAYVPPGVLLRHVRAPRRRLTRRPALCRCAAKARLLLRLVKQAAQAGHADVLRVFRVLVAEDVLVLGCVEQART